MKSAIRLNPVSPLLFMTLVYFTFSAPVPKSFAILPPPDGGYPNFTTAEGTNALKNLTSGAANTGLGWSSLLNVTTGSFNTGVGAGTLALNTGDSNTATGTAALLLNTTGTENTANGTAALLSNSDGISNSAFGAFALNSNLGGSSNTAVGDRALFLNTTGGFNTATGSFALQANTVGSDNTAVGAGSLESNTGSENTAIGSATLLFNTTGNHNTAAGFEALKINSADDNTACGHQALAGNTTGFGNTATGNQALFNNNDGNLNTAIGWNALLQNSSGIDNIALGAGAGDSLTTGSHNIYIANSGVAESGTIRIGNGIHHTQAFIAGISGVTVPGGVAVIIDANGHLGTNVSSQRFKDEIKPMDKASEAILALKPVTFRYKKEFDPNGVPQFGLVAEDVAKVNPDLVARDANGELYTVRYEAVNAMLLNEFLKEHKRVQEQQAQITALNSRVVTQEAINAQDKQEFHATIARQDNAIRALIATVKEQAAQIQKVSAQLEVGKGDVQVVCLRGVASREVEQNP
jgi:hypothetical protein